MNNINSHPMFVVEDAVYELRRLSSLCDIMTRMDDEGGHPAVNSIIDTLEILRRALNAQIKTLDAIQW